jgi:hypothetical protein
MMVTDQIIRRHCVYVCLSIWQESGAEIKADICVRYSAKMRWCNQFGFSAMMMTNQIMRRHCVRLTKYCAGIQS